MSSNLFKVACLLFGSGMCALIYQTEWTRELRLVFGASTPASAAVLAIFLGGLGAGGVVFGKRAESHPRPLALYARLELLIAASAALTPIWTWLARTLYVALGGAVKLGLVGGTIVRLILATLVLSVPTVLMGGTLPAAARAVEHSRDLGRSNLAILYGLNTLGAVLGTILSTFVLLERVGNRATLWLACAVNLLVGLIALRISKADVWASEEPQVEPTAPEPAKTEPTKTGPLPPVWFVLLAAALVGLAFLQLELVWYRMLSPILGGSTYTFGLILAVALLGIGLGGAGYAIWGRSHPPTLQGLSVLCLLEALLVIIPYAIGDRLALLALQLRHLGNLGFFPHVLGWLLVTSVVIFPASFVSGWQFPVLIALLGQGRKDVGRHVGQAYAFNTAGSILGSLLGGFGLLPLLSTPGAWRLAAGLLCALGVAACLLAWWRANRDPEAPRESPWGLPFAVVGTIAILGFMHEAGPTAVWRHSGIGVGRAELTSFTANSLRTFSNMRQRAIAWERDGIESSVALNVDNRGMAFLVNGKSDGSARGDAGTQVMLGMIGGVLHPSPRRAAVIGLGVGSTAGWLGAIPTMERVDVAEIEPNILRIARECTAVNQDILQNPKVHIFIGDGRELLSTTRERYDLIASEPSNPYRAGVASLYTQEFYRSVLGKLAEDGIFLQWAQTYDVDNRTVHTIYATLASVFPVVETWMTQEGDLLLAATRHPIRYDVPALRARIQTEPFKSALARVWRVTNLEGFLAHFVARDSLARALLKSQIEPLNSDDLTPAEFGFARSLSAGQGALFSFDELRGLAHRRKEDVPELSGGTIDEPLLDNQRTALYTASDTTPASLPFYTPEQQLRAAAHSAFQEGNLQMALQLWRQGPREPADLADTTLLAEALAEASDDAALPHIARIRAYMPSEADALLARLLLRKEQHQEAANAIEASFRAYQSDPWPTFKVMRRALYLALELSATKPELAPRLLALLKVPFSVGMLDQMRTNALISLSEQMGFGPHCLDVAKSMEPYVPWHQTFLVWRFNCYQANGSPHAATALRELKEFLGNEPKPFSAELPGSP